MARKNWAQRKEEYLQKLKDPRWQKKRLEILERDDWMCQKCGDTTTTLNVHHLCYVRNREPWDYPSGFFMTLCEPCHESETYDMKKVKEVIWQAISERPWLSEDLSYLLKPLCLLTEAFLPGKERIALIEQIDVLFPQSLLEEWDRTMPHGE